MDKTETSLFCYFHISGHLIAYYKVKKKSTQLHLCIFWCKFILLLKLLAAINSHTGSFCLGGWERGRDSFLFHCKFQSELRWWIVFFYWIPLFPLFFVHIGIYVGNYKCCIVYGNGWKSNQQRQMVPTRYYYSLCVKKLL